MLKRLLFTGCTLLLLTACGAGATEENASQTNQATTTNEAQTTNKEKNESTAVKESSDQTQKTAAKVDIANPPVSLMRL